MTISPFNGNEVELTELDKRVLNCNYGDYPWDNWIRMAFERGVNPSLANLGRSVMREAYQHAWPDHLMSLCGWKDGGKRMLELALRRPGIAKARWSRLLDTDGGRVESEYWGN